MLNTQNLLDLLLYVFESLLHLKVLLSFPNLLPVNRGYYLADIVRITLNEYLFLILVKLHDRVHVELAHLVVIVKVKNVEHHFHETLLLKVKELFQDLDPLAVVKRHTHIRRE